MNLENAKKIDGWMYESELDTLARWSLSCKNIVEVGTWKGRATMAICDNTNGKVYTIDHWKGPEEIDKWSYDYKEVIERGSNYVFNIFTQNLKEHLDSGKLTAIKKSSVQGSKYLTKTFGYNYFDLIFIDADHTFKHAEEDITLYLPLVKHGGRLAGHDFNWEGVREAVIKILPEYKTEGNIWYYDNIINGK